MANTPNKGYPLQATGANPGTWGTVLNTQALSVIDLNFGGRNNQDVSGAVDVTLSSTEAESIYQHYTGTLTGDISVIFPVAGAFYIITNGTSGAHTLTVKPDGGTGFVVPQGKTMLAFINADTTVAQEAVTYVTTLAVNSLTVASLSLSAALGVASGGTGAATLTSHGVLLGHGTSAVTGMTALSDGQLIVGQTGSDPLGKTISGDVTVAATGAVTIANSAVTTAKIADSNVTTAKIADANVTTVKIADNNVTLAKLAAQSNNTILANVSGGSAVPSANTVTQTFDGVIGSTQGSVIYRSGSAWTALTPGTASQVLMTGGAAANPAWAYLALSPGYSNLVVTGTSNTAFTITADAITVTDASTGQSAVLTGVSLTCTITTSGANGLDTGSEASNTWYSAWVIYNASTATTASLMSTSATAPTLPSGYTYKRRVGWVRNDGSSNLWRTSQKNLVATINPGTNPTGLPTVATGTAGSYSNTSPTWATPSVTSVVPTTASSIVMTVCGNYKSLGSGSVMVAPNNSYGGSDDSNGNPPFLINKTDNAVVNVIMPLSTTTVAWASNTSGGALVVNGWVDNL